MLSLSFLAGVALSSAAYAQPKPASPTAQATLLGQFGDWGAYTANANGNKVCFALAKPSSSVDIPANRRTAANPVYMFVSTRPSENVKDEVSMLVTGYALKSNTEATVGVGSANFAMYTQNDGAWVKNAGGGIATGRRHAQRAGRCGQGHHQPRHQDHRHILAQGHRAGAGARGPGVQVLGCHADWWQSGDHLYGMTRPRCAP